VLCIRAYRREQRGLAGSSFSPDDGDRGATERLLKHGAEQSKLALTSDEDRRGWSAHRRHYRRQASQRRGARATVHTP
jgi:hypothetical protein